MLLIEALIRLFSTHILNECKEMARRLSEVEDVSKAPFLPTASSGTGKLRRE